MKHTSPGEGNYSFSQSNQSNPSVYNYQGQIPLSRNFSISVIEVFS